MTPALVIILTLGSVAQTQVDTKALVRQSVANYQRDWHEAVNWDYQQTDSTHPDGTKEVEVSEIEPLYGTPFERPISKDGQSLSPAEQKKQQRKYRKALNQRENEGSEERQARIQKYAQERAFIKDIPDAYTFKLLGEEDVEGRPAWVIQLKPRPGFVPALEHASMLEHIDGKLWIDKEDVQWAKAEAHVIDTISIGWVLARIGPGARIIMEQTRVAPGFWWPKKITINGTARVLLVHNRTLNEELSYSGFHRDNTDLARLTPHPESASAQSFR